MAARRLTWEQQAVDYGYADLILADTAKDVVWIENPSLDHQHDESCSE
jgi:hypothetical protein